MSDLEKAVLKAGGVLVRNGRHKVYDVQGRRIIVSHGNKENRRDRGKSVMRFLTRATA